MARPEPLLQFQTRTLRWLLLLVLVHTLPVLWITPVVAGTAPIAALLAFALASLFTFDAEGAAMGLMVLIPALIYIGLAYLLVWLTVKLLLRCDRRLRLILITLLVVIPLGAVYFPIYFTGGHSRTHSSNLPELVSGYLNPTPALAYWISFHLLVLVLYAILFFRETSRPAAFLLRWGKPALQIAVLLFIAVITLGNYERMLCRPLAEAGLDAAQLCVAAAEPTQARYWYQRAAEDGNAEAILWLIGNTPGRQERLRWLTAGAEAGDPAIQFQLARHLQRYGPTTSDLTAQQWLEEAAAADYGPAQQQLVEALTTQVLESGSRELLQTRNNLLEKAAGNGSQLAMLRLAQHYTRGSMGYPAAMAEARSWYQKLLANTGAVVAADTIGMNRENWLGSLQQLDVWQAGLDADDPQITLELARLYLQSPLPGPGVRELGMKLFESLAEDDAAVRRELILMLRTGTDGADRDLSAARKWLLIAAEDGDTNAMDRVAGNYLNGSEGFPVDYPEAKRWIDALIEHYRNAGGIDAQSHIDQLNSQLKYIDRLERMAGGRLLGEQALSELAQASDADSHYRYALQLLAGHGAERRAEAVSRLQSASDLGHAEAAWRLVQIYERGFPAELNPAAAQRELQRAAERHHFDAVRELAARYEYGNKGFSRDLPRAIGMYEAALSAGRDNRYDWNLDEENYNHFSWLESRLRQAKLKLSPP